MRNPDPKDIYPLHHFANDLATMIKDKHDIRYCFVLGAGASRSSGIPTGAALVDKWLRSRFEQDHPKADRKEIAAWAEKVFRKRAGFTWENRAAFYGRIYEWYYPDEAIGQDALRQLIRYKSPSFGYSVLARILAETHHKIVLTTNFDNLVRDAIHLHVPNETPFICYGESDARYLAGHATHVRIAKLHGDIDRKTYNATTKTEKLGAVWDVPLRGIFTEYTPIFLGYGGNDPGVMNFLNDKLKPGEFRARPIWAYRVGLDEMDKNYPTGPVPLGCPDGAKIRQFMSNHNGLWLPIPGFDEFMLLLGHALDYGSQANVIRAEADRRARDYERTMSEAVKSLRSIPSKNWCHQFSHLAEAAESKLLGAPKRRSWDEWRVALESAPSLAEKEKLSGGGLKELKNSPELKAYYASVIAEQKPKAPQINRLIAEALAMAKKTTGIDSPTFLMVLHHQARISAFRGLSNKSFRQNEEVLKSRRKILGEEHPDTLLSASNLAALALSAQGKLGEAEKMNRQILEIRKRTLGKEHPDTLTSATNLAVALQLQDKFPEAEKMNRQTLEILVGTLGKEHPDSLGCESNLASVLYDQGHFAEAGKMYRRIFEIRERTLPKEHPDTLRSEANWALALFHLDRTAAEKIISQKLKSWERVLGKEHPDTLRCAKILKRFRQGKL